MKKLFSLLAMVGLFATACELGGDVDNTPINGGSIATIEEQMMAIKQSLPELRDVVAKANQLTSEPKATTRSDNNGVKTLIAELEARIAALEEYINNGGSGEWTDVTFATMEMYEDTIAILAALQAEVDALKEQNNALCNEVSVALIEGVNSMKSWINELLTGYYDIATVDAMFATLLEELSSADADIRAEIESLRTKLAEELTKMEKAYKDAIESAIEENNGLLDKKLTKAINDVNARIDTEVAKLNQRIDDIEERLTKLEGSVADLLKRIQSIAYVPIYDDGKARVNFPNNDTLDSTLQLDFMISPRDAASDLARVYKDAVSIQVLYSGSPIMTNMPVISCDVVASQGLFSVICACDNISMEFYNGDVTARAIMYVSDGNNDLTSEYITIVPNHTQIQNNQIWYTVSNKLPIKINQSSGPRIVSNEYDQASGYYIITYESEINTIPQSYFSGQSELTSVILPNSVNSIGHWAFALCNCLADITLSNSLSYIGSYAFESCDLSSLTLPNRLMDISPDAFKWSSISHLEGEQVADDGISLIINGTLAAIAPLGINGEYVVPIEATTIANAVFKDCYNIQNIVIHDNVTSIGNEAFMNCPENSSINISINIPESVTTIGSSAFHGCSGELTINSQTMLDQYYSSTPDWLEGNMFSKLTIGDGIEKIGNYTFFNCNSLTSVTLPDSITSIGNAAFNGCSNLTSVYYNGDISTWCKIDFKNTDSTPLCYGAKLYFDNNEVTEITIPSDISEIKKCTFNGCRSLTSVTIPESVTTINDYAFASCYSLTNVYYNGDLSAWCQIDFGINGGSNPLCNGSKLYINNTEVTEITIPSEISEIKKYAFNGCNSLTSITIHEGVTSIGMCAFDGCTGELIVNCNIPSASASSPSYGAFYNSKFTNVTIGDSVTTIGDYAFYNCNSLKNITIPDSVTNIGMYAFYHCRSLTSTTIPNSVTNIGYKAFEGCRGEMFVNCDIPSNVFAKSEFTKITIGEDVTTIGNSAFYYCGGELVVNSKIIEKHYDYNSRPSATSWLKDAYFTKLSIGNSISRIGNNVFAYCSKLTSVTISDSVTTIGDSAFALCTSLKSITIPDSVTTIGKDAFLGCGSLTSVYYNGDLSAWCNIDFYDSDSNPLSNGAKLYINNTEVTEVTIPSDISVIKDYTFCGCSSLKSVTIPDSVTSIGSSAFDGCSSLTSITIPESVNSIGEEAFYNCSSLTSVYCKATTPPAGGTDMFYGNASGLTIYVPRNSVDLYKSASGWSFYASDIVGYDF